MPNHGLNQILLVGPFVFKNSKQTLGVFGATQSSPLDGQNNKLQRVEWSLQAFDVGCKLSLNLAIALPVTIGAHNIALE
jgi:hypothetical protein